MQTWPSRSYHFNSLNCSYLPDLVDVPAADGADAGEGAHAAVHPLPAAPTLEPGGAHRPDRAARPAHPAVLPEAEQLEHLAVHALQPVELLPDGRGVAHVDRRRLVGRQISLVRESRIHDEFSVLGLVRLMLYLQILVLLFQN